MEERIARRRRDRRGLKKISIMVKRMNPAVSPGIRGLKVVPPVLLPAVKDSYSEPEAR